MSDLSIVVPAVLAGLTTGAVYALVSLGLTLIYGVMKILNMAHGSLYALGAYVAATLIGACVVATRRATSRNRSRC